MRRKKKQTKIEVFAVKFAAASDDLAGHQAAGKRRVRVGRIENLVPVEIARQRPQDFGKWRDRHGIKQRREPVRNHWRLLVHRQFLRCRDDGAKVVRQCLDKRRFPGRRPDCDIKGIGKPVLQSGPFDWRNSAFTCHMSLLSGRDVLPREFYKHSLAVNLHGIPAELRGGDSHGCLFGRHSCRPDVAFTYGRPPNRLRGGYEDAG